MILDPASALTEALQASWPGTGHQILAQRQWPARVAARHHEAADGLQWAVTARDRLRVDELATETYRRITVDEALNMLAPSKSSHRRSH